MCICYRLSSASKSLKDGESRGNRRCFNEHEEFVLLREKQSTFHGKGFPFGGSRGRALLQGKFAAAHPRAPVLPRCRAPLSSSCTPRSLPHRLCCLSSHGRFSRLNSAPCTPSPSRCTLHPACGRQDGRGGGCTAGSGAAGRGNGLGVGGQGSTALTQPSPTAPLLSIQAVVLPPRPPMGCPPRHPAAGGQWGTEPLCTTLPPSCLASTGLCPSPAPSAPQVLSHAVPKLPQQPIHRCRCSPRAPSPPGAHRQHGAFTPAHLALPPDASLPWQAREHAREAAGPIHEASRRSHSPQDLPAQLPVPPCAFAQPGRATTEPHAGQGPRPWPAPVPHGCAELPLATPCPAPAPALLPP